jgi:predicted nucleotidyltransferase
MVQKCSRVKVLEVFFKEPTNIHYIKEISRKIDLAPTSVRKYIKELNKEGLIKKKESKPFDGWVANRENEEFIYYKRVYNFWSLKNLADYLENKFYPKITVVFGSYCLGEDVEDSDIDILIISKNGKNLDLKKYEKELNRGIHLIVENSLNKLNKKVRKKVKNGIVLSGSF